MSITLNTEVQEAIESRMKERGFTDPNEIVLEALRSLDEHVFAYEDLDEDTRAAIERAEKQESIPAEIVHQQLLRRYDGGK